MNRQHTKRRELIDVAMGRKPADTLVRGGKLVNVMTSEIYSADIAIKGDRIAAIGDVKRCRGSRTDIIDANKAYLVPGLIEPHVHFYHGCLNVTNYTRAILNHGVTTVADGFNTVGIIAGVKGIRFMIEEFKRTPVKLIFAVSIAAYLQNRRLGIPPAPNSVRLEDLFQMLDWPETHALEEPAFHLVTEKEKPFLDLFEKAIKKRMSIHGHAYAISIPELNAYVAAGAVSDHESTDVLDAIEKARVGLKVLMRQGSGAYDVKELSKALTEHHLSSRGFSFCVDMAAPEKIFYEGDINEAIRVAMRAGVNPVTAIQMGTLNAAESFGQHLEIGSIAPGRIADVLFVKDLRDFDIVRVIANGETVVKDGKCLTVPKPPHYPDFMYGTIRLKRPVVPDDFHLRASREKTYVKARIIAADGISLYTPERIVRLKVVSGIVQSDPEKDILRISMIDRHAATGQIGNAFVTGFRLAKGAIASSVSVLCQNIVVVGTNNDDMAIAVNHLSKVGGGHVVVADGKILAELELPLLGLLSDAPLDQVVEKSSKVYQEIKKLGCPFTSPLTSLAFCCACDEIGKIKLFQGGLIDAEKGKRVSVILE